MTCEHMFITCRGTFRHKLLLCLTRSGLPEIHRRPPALRAFPVVGTQALGLCHLGLTSQPSSERELPGFRQ